jgi:hypothetical protein
MTVKTVTARRNAGRDVVWSLAVIGMGKGAFFSCFSQKGTKI